MSARRITWPLSLANGRLVTHRADTLADVRQCIALLTRTPHGSRPLSPDVGFEEALFTTSVDVDELQRRLEELEPRARVTATVTTSADGRTAVRSIRVALADDPSAPEVPA